MIGLSLTLDYEIYGDGTGNLNDQVLGPTRTFLDVCEEGNAKGTIFAEAAEFMAMRKSEFFREEMDAVEHQLRTAHERGHDVQLHIHPWWFGARLSEGRWKLYYSASSLGDLTPEDAALWTIQCKNYLTGLFHNAKRPYSCIAFRAGAWVMTPTAPIHHALVEAGIKVDTSVYKWGKMKNISSTDFNYSTAQSHITPWFFHPQDVNRSDMENSRQCLEIPIYTELHHGFSFVHPKRLKIMISSKSAISGKRKKIKDKFSDLLHFLISRQPKKFDFCKCSFMEMKRMLQNIVRFNPQKGYLPVVAIGHSKDFFSYKDLSKLLSYINKEFKDVVEIVPLSESYNKLMKSCDTIHFN